MHTWKSWATALLALMLLAVSASAWSDRGRYYGRHHGHRHSDVSVGFVFGGPLWGPPLWYPPAYVYPPAVVVPPEPRVYIERDPAVVLGETNHLGSWYYCRDSNTYYPYVKECAGPWERVPARPQ